MPTSENAKVKYGVVVAARSGSTRLPGKALLPMRGVPMLSFLLRRLQGSRRAGRILLATTDLPEDDRLEALSRSEGIPVFRGDKADLVKRFVAAVDTYPCEYTVRVTADCPFLDSESLDYCLDLCDQNPGFAIAATKKAFPVGLDFEIYPSEIMRKIQNEASLDDSEREHLTLHLYNHPDRFPRLQLSPPRNWPPTDRAFTVDTLEDYQSARALADRITGINATVPEIIAKAG